MIEDGDTIAVGVSGGKDSLLLAKLMQEIQKYHEVEFNLKFICMDPGYTANNLALLQANCLDLGIDLIIKKSDFFAVVQEIAADNPCYLCARMRRGFLYKMAQDAGCNKLALAHHFDDVIETTLLNVFYAGEFKTMMPKIQAENFANLQLIRPLFFVKEHDIRRFTTTNQITALDCGCTVAAQKTASKRAEMKELIAKLRQDNDQVDACIFNAAINVNLDAVLGYKANNKHRDFNEIFFQRHGHN